MFPRLLKLMRERLFTSKKLKKTIRALNDKNIEIIKNSNNCVVFKTNIKAIN